MDLGEESSVKFILRHFLHFEAFDQVFFLFEDGLAEHVVGVAVELGVKNFLGFLDLEELIGRVNVNVLVWVVDSGCFAVSLF
jgi:hypothetical protein